jgi:hypothetical protein
MQRLLLCWPRLQRSKVSTFIFENCTTYFHLAEIDRLNKLEASKPVEKPLEEIPRPAKITNLQIDMGLADNKRLYSHCRVSSFFHWLPSV